MNCLTSMHLCARHLSKRPFTRLPKLQAPAFPLRQFPRMASSAFQFAEGEDAQQLTRDADALLQQGWAQDGDGMGVTKTFHFKSYFKAVAFVNMIAAESASKKHHPTMTVRIGSVDVHWTTHRPRGFTQKDVTMAQHCDRGADLMGTVDPGQGLKCGPTV
ncbi:Pc20g15080 [Penicillium rubens Wisconsin 54-1255]|uniref:4a-hydroxytetrahydrobiopterin dehydratase n=2 Tax=Penicillium chrysogenum species complex TaxID=254878 RepID=B6HDW4_PENRW|nr:uncharacterized protein N7525_009879 [Penicillium rubens]KAJ5831626.1 hypothetical protein N7525_009879 [Penicillium rubens]KAJ5855176.1 hypothetical protein N7534_007719 [Penicillium rubens]CAP86837.1 Pc20g15080 [Penicillium rubens Wisconsin 54-1255]